MVALQPSTVDVGLRDVGFGVLSLAAISLTIVVQLLWMIAFDETGLDTAVPDVVFVNLLPALALAIVPAAAATRLYGRRGGVVAGAVVFLAVLAVSTYTAGFFALCGARC